MARILTYDPGTSEIRSPLLASLTEACNKLSGVLDMKTNTFVDADLSELYITDDDRYRIYQIANGRRLWLQNPMPIIKKNGVQITESNDRFSIDYLGGSIAFETGYTLTAEDHITASATYITDSSNKIAEIINQISLITETAGHYKGYYETIEELEVNLPNGIAGDYVLIGEDNSFHIWDTETNSWISSQASADVSNFYDKSQIDNLLKQKENALSTDELAEENKNKYYLTANKTWEHFSTQVLGTILTDLDTTVDEKITALDTVVSALGKLQAQLDKNIGGISGVGMPSEITEGVIGQDYINVSNGDKYYLASVEEQEDGTKKYNWVQYAKKADTPTNAITIDKGANMTMPEDFGEGEWQLVVVDEADDEIAIDETPTEGSTNAVSSGGVYNALQEKSNRPLAFRVYLTQTNWQDYKQTITDERFTASDDYGFYVSPVGSDYRDYTENNVFLYNMDNGTAVFECDSIPSKTLTLDIIRSEVQTRTNQPSPPTGFDPDLPEGYKRVKYIKNTDTIEIIFGEQGSNFTSDFYTDWGNRIIEFKIAIHDLFSETSNMFAKILFGLRFGISSEDNSSLYILSYDEQNHKLQYSYGYPLTYNDIAQKRFKTVSLSVLQNTILNIKITKNSLTVNETTVNLENVNPFPICKEYIFGGSRSMTVLDDGATDISSGYYNEFQYSFYEAKISSETNELLGHLIPFENPDGLFGVYDKVSHTVAKLPTNKFVGGEYM